MATKQGAFQCIGICPAAYQIGGYFCVLQSSEKDQELLDKMLAKATIKSVPIMKTSDQKSWNLSAWDIA